jgi:uncharacterized protein YjbJ (UPF0337 family)
LATDPEKITGLVRRGCGGQSQLIVLKMENKLARALHSTSCRAATGASSSIAYKEQAMNWDRVQGNWKQVTGKVKQQWGKLTDDTLTEINGERDELVGKIQEAYGLTRDEADRQVRDWEKKEKLN